MVERRSSDNVIVHICKVEDYKDPYESNRIKVRFPGVDAEKETSDLPWCFPLLPKLVHIAPKANEGVLVIMEKTDAPNDNRYYIGPVISQQYFNDFDPFVSTSVSGLTDAKLKMVQAPSKNPENNGILPEVDDVAIIGRGNTDVILKPNEVLIRCGIKNNPTNGKIESRLEANLVDPAYIQMFYKKDGFTDDSKSKMSDRSYSSVINVVADRINLLSRTSKDSFNLYPKMLYDRDTGDCSTKENEITDVVNGAHPLVYGDELIDFLKKFVEMFRTHTHPFSMKPQVPSNAVQTFVSTDLDSMLSKSIKIN